jgi:hypothetical protein
LPLRLCACAPPRPVTPITPTHPTKPQPHLNPIAYLGLDD